MDIWVQNEGYIFSLLMLALIIFGLASTKFDKLLTVTVLLFLYLAIYVLMWAGCACFGVLEYLTALRVLGVVVVLSGLKFLGMIVDVMFDV